MTKNIPVASSRLHTSFSDENSQIVEEALKLSQAANDGYVRTRTVSDGVAGEVARRALSEVGTEAFSVRKHAALASVSQYISLVQKNKIVSASAQNTDLLPIAHPSSTQMHALSIHDYLAAKARWFADDPAIKNDEVRAMVASMLLAEDGSSEREYYRVRLENLPQGEVPVRALLAAFKMGANKGFWRFQRRDRKGRFAWMGGGISALVRDNEGVVRRLSGRTVSSGSDANGDYFDMEVAPGSLARIPAKSAEASKAFLASSEAVNGLSPVRARTQAGDDVIGLDSVVRPEAPAGFSRDESWSPSPEEVEFYGEDVDFGTVFSDGNYRFRKFDRAGDSPIAMDNFRLARAAERSCGAVAASGALVAAVDGDNCPISTDGAGPDGDIDPALPAFFAERENDSENSDTFSATQSNADLMRDIRQDEEKYARGEAPGPNKLTGLADANSDTSQAALPSQPRVVRPGGPRSGLPALDGISKDLRPGMWIPGKPPFVPSSVFVPRRPRPGRRLPGKGPWGPSGPSQGHAPFPIPGRRVFPGEIADMRVGSEIEQILGNSLARLFGGGQKRQLRKISSSAWVDLISGERLTNEQVANLASTAGTDRSPFVGLATGPEVRPGRLLSQLSKSLFPEMPIGSEVSRAGRLIAMPGPQFRKIGFDQWRRWDGKIFTDAQIQNLDPLMKIDRVGEFGSGRPPREGQPPSGPPAAPSLPRGPISPEDFPALPAGAVVSVPGDEGMDPRFFEKIGDNEWREVTTDTSMPDPLIPFSNDDILAIGRDITLELLPEEFDQGQVGMRPSDLSPEALEGLPTGVVVGVPDEVVDALEIPRREGSSDEQYEEALEAAKQFYRRNRWRKRGPNDWANDFGEFATDADIVDRKKTPGAILRLGDEFDAPEGYYELDRDGYYIPEGSAEGQTSPDFTDDPSELAQRFGRDELEIALQEALRNPNGFGELPFDEGDEPVPAEALYFALVRSIGVDGADAFVDRVYGEGREFSAEQDLAREFPDILSDDPDKRQAALIAAWNSQWGRSRFALDDEGNFTIVGDDNDSLAARYLLDQIMSESWGQEFMREFQAEYSEVITSRTQREFDALYDAYPGLRSEDPEERKDSVFRALDAIIQDDEFVTDEDGNILEVTPRTALSKALWDMSQEFIGETFAPVGSKTSEVPAVVEGATPEEREVFDRTGDTEGFLPTNPENFDDVADNLYNVDPEPYDPADGPEETNPVNLSINFTADELREQLREAILRGNGYGVVAFEGASGEPVEFSVPAEALRDALQLQGEEANEFIQGVYNDNPSPARSARDTLDQVASLEAEAASADGAQERRNFSARADRLYRSLGGYFRAISDYKKREAALGRLARRRGLTDEQRELVAAKLAEVTARREQFEDIATSDLENGQQLTPFEESTEQDLEKFDFERGASPAAPTDEVAPTDVPTAPSVPEDVVAPVTEQEPSGPESPALPTPNPNESFRSPSKKAIAEFIRARIKSIESFVRETLAPLLKDEDEEAQKDNARLETIKRRLRNRLSKQRNEPEIGVDPKDSRLLNIRPIDFRTGDVFFDDHFTITRVELGEVETDERSPYFGERKVTYFGYYPGGQEQEKALPENFKSQAVYRGVGTPLQGDLPALNAPKTGDFLPDNFQEIVNQIEDESQRAATTQIERDPVDGRERRSLYVPRADLFPEAYERFMSAYDDYERRLAEQRASWSPGDEVTPGGSALESVSDQAQNLKPGDITFRVNSDGTKEFFVVQSVETRQVQTGTRTVLTPSTAEDGGAPSDVAQAAFDAAVQAYPAIDGEDAAGRKRSYAKLLGEWYREAQAAGQARKSGQEYEPLEGPLGDQFGWLLSQKARILAGEKLSPEGVGGGAPQETEEGIFEERTVVTGYHPGHQVQEKKWRPGTNISVIRGEADLPASGDRNPVAGTSEIESGGLAERSAILNESASLYSVDPSLITPTARVENPQGKEFSLISRFSPAFYGKKILDLVRGKTGPEIKEELKKKRLVFFDFETVGGFNRRSPAAPIQVAAVSYENGVEVGRLVLDINPGTALSDFYYDQHPKTAGKKSSPDELLVGDLPEGSRVGKLIDGELVTFTKRGKLWVNEADEADTYNSTTIKGLGNGGAVLKIGENGEISLRDSRLKGTDGNPITDEYLAQQPGIEEQLRNLVEFFGEDPYLVAFNADFDVNVLSKWAEKFGIDFANEGFIDPLPIARSLRPGESGNSLAETASRFGIIRNPEDWHNAEIDAEVLPELLDALLDGVDSDNPTLDLDARVAEYENGVDSFDRQMDQFLAQQIDARPPAPEAAPEVTPEAVPEESLTVPDENEPVGIPVGKAEKSLMGDTISSSWALDDQNTEVVSDGKVGLTDVRLGDFVPSKNGDYSEIVGIDRDPVLKTISFLYRNLSDGIIYRVLPQVGITDPNTIIGSDNLPVRRRRTLAGMTNQQIVSEINKLNGPNLGLQRRPSVNPQNPDSAQTAVNIDALIEDAAEIDRVERQRALEFVEPTLVALDKNGVALAEDDEVYSPPSKNGSRGGRTGVVRKINPNPLVSNGRIYYYISVQWRGGKNEGVPTPANKVEKVLPAVPSVAATADPQAGAVPVAPLGTPSLPADVAAAVFETPVMTDPIQVARKISRLSSYLNAGPGFIPLIGNNVKAALVAYKRGDYDTAEKAINRAEEYANFLETPKRTLAQLQVEIRDRATKLRSLIARPDTSDAIKGLFGEVVGNYLRQKFGAARDALNKIEDLLWNEGVSARSVAAEKRAQGLATPEEIKLFNTKIGKTEGDKDSGFWKEITSALDSPITGGYFRRVLRLAQLDDYTLDGDDESGTEKKRIVAEALAAVGAGFIVPGYQILERLAYEREKQVKSSDVDWQEEGAETLDALTPEQFRDLIVSGSIRENSGLPEVEKETPEETLARVAAAGKQYGLFFTNVGNILPGDIVSIRVGDVDVPFRVTRARKGRNTRDADGNVVENTSYSLWASPQRGATKGNSEEFVFDTTDEIFIQYRPGNGQNLPSELMSVGASKSSSPDFNEFEGLLDEEVIEELDDLEMSEDIKLAMARRSAAPAAEETTATIEQGGIVQAILDGVKRIKVTAFAGTGKTTTFKMAAKAIRKKDPKAKILMLMFNTALRDETMEKMPEGVFVNTTGQFAARALTQQLKTKRKEQADPKKRPNIALTTSQQVKELGIQGPQKMVVLGEEREISPSSMILAVRQAVLNYSISADEKIGPEHFDEKYGQVPPFAVALAQSFWDKSTDPSGNLELRHEHVIKLWSLSKPDLTKAGSGVPKPFEGSSYLFFDEAQDINPVVESVINDQKNFESMIWVGDSRQAIYQFMGAVDALKRYSADIALSLTESFRFGAEIAGMGNRFLALLGENKRMKGSGPSGEIVSDLASTISDNPDDLSTIVISRTNPGGLKMLAEFVGRGVSVAIDEKTLQEYDLLLNGISWLRARQSNPGLERPKTLHPDLAIYDDFGQLLEQKKEGLAGGGASAILNVLQQFGGDEEGDIRGLRNLISTFQVVRDIPTAQKGGDFTPLTYDSTDINSLVQYNAEAANSNAAKAYYWIGEDGTMYARAFRSGPLAGYTAAYSEASAMSTYLKSIGFKWDSDAPIDSRLVADKSLIMFRDDPTGAWVMADGSPMNSSERDRLELANQISRYANNYFQTDTTPVSFTTAHKAKGKEWDRVLISEDWSGPEANEETLEWELPSEEELNLMYVAVTRAQRVLDLGGLSWILEETTEEDGVFKQEKVEETRLGMSVPTRRVSKVKFVDMVDEADAALTTQQARVADAVQKALAMGGTPTWLEPWQSNSLPTSAYTGTAYSGTNLLYLQAVAKINGWKDARWITPDELSRRGGTVTAGESATTLTNWVPSYSTVMSSDGGTIETPSVFTLSPEEHLVYNIEQVSGVSFGEVTAPSTSTFDAENDLLGGYLDAPAVVTRTRTREEEAADDLEAFYSVAQDTISLPDRSRFPTPEKYFEALAHELIHSTGASNRLNRPSTTTRRSSLSAEEAEAMQVEEEFVAQIGMAILASRLGVKLDLPNTVAYMQQWQDIYGDKDPGLISRAAKRAQEAADYIMRGYEPRTTDDVALFEAFMAGQQRFVDDTPLRTVSTPATRVTPPPSEDTDVVSTRWGMQRRELRRDESSFAASSPALDTEQEEALAWYTDNGFDAANRSLRLGEEVTAEDQAKIREVLDLIDASELTSPAVLYRGRPSSSPARAAEMNALQIGNEITDTGIVSTTIDPSRADFYANMDITGAKARVVFKINAPEGAKAFEIPEEFSTYLSDREVLLPPGTVLRVTNIADENGIKYIEADLVLGTGAPQDSTETVSPEDDTRLGMARPQASSSARNFSSKTSSTADKAKEISQQVTDIVVRAIESGEDLPWKKPWSANNIFTLPTSVNSGLPYKGQNIMILWAAALSKGYKDNRWMTYAEAVKRGGNVIRGEKSTTIVNYSPQYGDVVQEDGTTKKDVLFMRLKTIPVFNVEQTENLTDPLPEPEFFEPIPVGEAEQEVLDKYTDAPPVNYVLQDAAFWQPSADEISMPLREQFDSPEKLLATLFHEFVHSTGHKKRLDRSDLGEKYSTHLDSRGQEELIAEIGSAILAARLNVQVDLDSVAGYAKSWLAPLKNDPDMISKAAQRAQAAVDYILGEGPNLGESGNTGDERAAEILDQNLGIETGEAYLGEYGRLAEDLIAEENRGDED